MGQSPKTTLSALVELMQRLLTDIEIQRFDVEEQVSVLKLRGKYEGYDVFVSEIYPFSQPRKYSYYVLKQRRVVAGFDNAPDTKALRLKYGRKYTQFKTELIPHQHGADKKFVILTRDMFGQDFASWIEENL